VTSRKSRTMSLKSRAMRLLIPSLAGISLLLNSGCGILSRTRVQEDHVFSSALPQESEISAGRHGATAEAHYPDGVPSDEVAPHQQVQAQYQQAQAQYREMPGTADDAAAGIVRMNAVVTRKNTVIANAETDDAGFLAAASQIQLASYQTEEFTPAGHRHSPTFIPAEPRRQVDACDELSNRMETIAASPDADLYPDEYIFDGGDRNAPAGYVAGQRSGFDTEDTVAKYTDHTGSARTSPSNRVAVYAPRFGSVRTVQGLQAGTKVDKAAGARDSQGVGNVKSGNAAQENVHDTILSGLESRSRVDGMEGSTPPMQAQRADAPVQNRKVAEGHEGRHYAGSNSMQRHEGFVMQQQIQNAVAWTRDQYPVLTASTTNASLIKATFKVQQQVGVEDERQTKGNIHVVKLADHEMAQSGDTISFTIRFENTGDFDVYDVSIVDNLTPRLEYVPGTAQIDGEHPGEVIVEDNGEGTSILTFNLDRELKGHDRGEITFEARVR